MIYRFRLEDPCGYRGDSSWVICYCGRDVCARRSLSQREKCGSPIWGLSGLVVESGSQLVPEVYATCHWGEHLTTVAFNLWRPSIADLHPRKNPRGFESSPLGVPPLSLSIWTANFSGSRQPTRSRRGGMLGTPIPNMFIQFGSLVLSAFVRLIDFPLNLV